MTKFFSYFFSPLPGTKFAFYWPSLTLFLILLAGSLVLYILVKKLKNPAFKRVYGDAPSALFSLGLIWGFIIFSRYENIAFFSMRFLMYITLVVLLVWVAKQVYRFFNSYKKESARLEQARKTPKYSFKKGR